MEDLTNVETRRLVEEVWDNHPSFVQDQRIRWDLAWARTMPSQVVERGRRPNSMFPCTLESKSQTETIKTLQLEDGSNTKDLDRIIQEVRDFHTSLFKKDREDEHTPGLREETLAKLETKVPLELNQRLKAIPDLQEIEQRVHALASEKAPGLEGITAEVLRVRWHTIKLDYLTVIQEFWKDERLTTKAKKGVMKLLPKNDEYWLLINWRPITLLGITYKLVSKIIAERLKPFMSSLVRQQQTGFIPYPFLITS
ncbi:hypothetical protein R1sor_013918 [Riccia sorocarpa]|uniref:Reverse transcriptase domain-containing protein n=1 Tax=Riccia sorocarpa TaxID=122646 RepID=A0ABD3HBT0_9MARC